MIDSWAGRELQDGSVHSPDVLSLFYTMEGSGHLSSIFIYVNLFLPKLTAGYEFIFTM